MVAVQRVKESEITEQDSLLLTRNLLRIAIYNISYIRGLFPENYFNDKSVPALEMKIKKLMPMDAESRRLIDWMEKGVYDALQRKYLKTLLFCISEAMEGPMIEEYAFSFSYSSSDSDEVSMNITRNKKQGATFKSNTAEITPNQMRSSACKMIRTLVQLMRTLDGMPDERIILMKLLYHEDVTPTDYEPPFFRSCSDQEASNLWTKNPLKMEVGNVNSKHILLTLKVKSVLDSCEDENDDLHNEDDVSLGADSLQQDNSSSDSEVHHSPEDQFILAPKGNNEASEDMGIDPEDATQDPEKDEEKLALLREWIASRHTDTVDLTDVLSNFPDISVVLTEELIKKLVAEGLITIVGRDTYIINKPNPEIAAVKDEMDVGVEHPSCQKVPKSGDEDYMYMKALYHALPMDYVSVAKLQSKLGKEAGVSTVRKLIDKMTLDGFVEVKSHRRLGKRVIHSDSVERRFQEIKRALDDNSTSEMEFDDNGVIKPIEQGCPPAINSNDASIYGGVHSIGSDLTRTQGRSHATLDGSLRIEQQARDNGNTPMSKAHPIASRESVVAGIRNEKQGVDLQKRICSHSTQDKRLRRASTVKEPIPQFVKRFKSQAS